MSYLVTGGTGLIGAYVTRLLVQEGEKVVTFNRNPRRTFLDRLMTKKELQRVEVIQGDTTDLAHLIRTVQEHGVEKIIHMAHLLTTASSANPPLAVRVNCEGTVNVLETARILGLKKVIWASSLAIFGARDKYTQEYVPNDAPHYPVDVYGACKNFIEVVAEHYFNAYKVDNLGLRYGVVYGAGQESGASGRLTNELLINPALGKSGRVPFGDDVLSWLYVDDAARATVMASKTKATKTRAFTVNGDFRSVAEAIDYVKSLIPGADIAGLPGYAPFPSKYDGSRTKEEIGYYPQYPMEKGMKAVIDDVRIWMGKGQTA
jgi:UDP-glucose 4-epimerase